MNLYLHNCVPLRYKACDGDSVGDFAAGEMSDWLKRPDVTEERGKWEELRKGGQKGAEALK